MNRVDRFELLTADPTRQALHAEAMREEHPDMFEDEDMEQDPVLELPRMDDDTGAPYPGHWRP